MRHDHIELRGTYRYTNRAELECALREARSIIEEDELGDLEPQWIDVFVRNGATLSVDVRMPHTADRYLAASVLEALARSAIDGVVEALHGGRCVDWFPSRSGAT